MKNVVFFLLCPIFILAGCWDTTEAERMLYILGMGVDYKDGKYEVYAQIVDFTNVAKSEQPNQEATQAEVGYAKGENLDEAIFDLYHSMDIKLFWGHFKYFVFSEEILKNEHVNAIINNFTRFNNTRYNTWVYSTKDDVKEVMLLAPIINKSITLSKLSDPLNRYRQESFIEPMNLRKLIMRLNEPNNEVKIPWITVSDNWETAKGPQKVTQLKGVGILSKDKFKGFLDEKQTKGLQWMTNDTKRGEVTVQLDDDPQDLLTVTIENMHVKIKPIVKGETIKFDITVKVEAILSEFKGVMKEKTIKQAIEKEIKKEIKTTYDEGLKMDADVYGFSEYAFRHHMKTWKKVQQDGKIPLSSETIRNIKVEVEKLDSGRKEFKQTIK